MVKTIRYVVVVTFFFMFHFILYILLSCLADKYFEIR